jgi:hypothetical protein
VDTLCFQADKTGGEVFTQLYQKDNNHKSERLYSQVKYSKCQFKQGRHKQVNLKRSEESSTSSVDPQDIST